MVARLGSRWDLRRDRDGPGRARLERERSRSEAEPRRRRAANVGLAHDLRATPQIEREAGTTGSVTIASKVPARAEPGDHDALVLFTTRRRVTDGLAVRVRMGVVVVVRAPGAVVHRIELRALRVAPRGRARVLELVVANRGNVTESVGRARGTISLFRGGRRLARLAGEPREFRPGTKGLVQFRYRGRAYGLVTARVELAPDSGVRVFRRAFRVRL